ncbi:arginine transport system permease protein ArtQ [Pantoea ananatis AJ13355]|uniref:Arginine transport system permease protein ArtQ n=1 Tax=Pantoea ananatis (strain AJ13355) TaxID=932677 RepID=A0A0H3KTJ6_PANAA|nr:arginine transport system permease protein ArtQ [Pantoea ananatis AJ13355]
MNEIIPLASAAGMTVGLAVCALIAGLVLAMIFAGWESLRLKPLAWIGTTLVTLIRGLPEILVVLFIYFGASQLLLTLSDGFTLNFGLFRLPVQMHIENFDVSPFLCGVIALAMLYAGLCFSNPARRAESRPDWTVGIRPGARHEKVSDFFSSDYAANVAPCLARPGKPVAGFAKGYGAGVAD